MISETSLETLKSFVPEENIRLREPMALHTTFRAGGEADCLIELENEEQLKKVQRYLELIEEPFILGNGSNLLVSDEGYRGVVLKIGKKMSGIVVEGTRIMADAGALMSQAARAAMEHGLTGLEFAAGIPAASAAGL